jgi:hypothetical protein
MNFPLNRSTDADEYERFRREDRRAYLISVAVAIAIVGGVGLAIYAAI